MRASYKLLVLVIVFAISSVFVIFNYTELYLIQGFDKALEGVLLFASISLGFYGACMSVIASIFNTKIVQEIMQEKEDKIEFAVIVFSTLVSGFLAVIVTIVYRVCLVNFEKGNLSLDFMNYLSASWFGIVVLFVSMNFLFIIVSFLIFFSNKKEKSHEEKTLRPRIKPDKLAP